MKRRDFIKLSTTASAAALMPFDLNAMFESDELKNCDFSNRKLILINLDGGNDGLNTIVPVNQYDIYSNLRPTIRVPESGLNKYISLDSGLAENQLVGLHPILTDFKRLYDEGKMQIIQGVGYPSANKSHFTSSDMMMTGNDGNGWGNGKDSGWIGRYMENMYASELGKDYPFAVQMGNVKNSLGFFGEHEHGMNMNITNQDASGFYSIINGLGGEAPKEISKDSDFGIELDYIVETDKLANIYAGSISNAFNLGSNEASYPDTDLSNQLKTVARMIKGGLKSKIFMVRLKGFDTHAMQLETGGNDVLGRHYLLLEELSGAIGAFMNDISSIGLEEDVMAITYSEFGRKVAENGNLGTDHGEIAPIFIFGNTIEGGMTGINPDLNEAIEDNNWQIETIQHDYRSVFGTLLKDWMGGDAEVLDKTFYNHTTNTSFNDSTIDHLVKSSYKIDEGCSSGIEKNVFNSNESCTWFASPNPFSNELTLRNENDVHKIIVYVYNQSGQLVKVINTNYSNGNVRLELSALSPGNYTLKIASDGRVLEVIKVVKR
ncbi:MAG: hypothetical protein CMP61_12430 [Flavobacteriales bacterium]|nr:hypothetical protein [Flavobacteriales bacterium]|tara:strand:+ start:1681 stop:3321 length:1641 start_codon:yes stop_codon:yes gene_type:complete